MEKKFLKTASLMLIFFSFIVSCGKKNNNGEIDYPPLGTAIIDTIVVKLDNQSNGALVSLDNSSITFNTTSQLTKIKKGNIIVGAPSTLADNGFLRFVNSISVQGSNIVFSTTNATLDDLFTECNIQEVINVDNWTRSPSITSSLDAILYDKDNDTLTSGDQVKVTGSIEIKPKFILELKKKKGSKLALGYAKFGFTMDITKSMYFNAKAEIASYTKDVKLGKPFKSTPILIGGIVWIRPSVQLSVGAEGSISANMKFGGEETTTTNIYKEYINNSFSNLKYEKTTTGLNPVFDISGEAEAEVYLKTKLELKVYEIIGINASAKTYLKGNVEISTTNLNQIDYCLKAGLKAGVGVEASIFGQQLGSAEIETKLWEAPMPATQSFNPCGSISNGTTVTDIDGNIYNTITIGTQTWMVENLKTTKYNDGNTILNITDSLQWRNTNNGAWCYLNNVPSNNSFYGKLYNYYAVNSGKLAPTGWHIPSKAEWETLFNYVGGIIVAGKKLKQTGSTHWYSPSISTNEFGFTAMPGGERGHTSSSDFTYIAGTLGEWWTMPTSTIFDYIYMSNTSDDAQILISMNTEIGMSVRCIKD